MNDFTKEELAWMESRIFYGMSSYEHQSMVYRLRKKLQVMIDNHQETFSLKSGDIINEIVSYDECEYCKSPHKSISIKVIKE